MYSSCSMHNFIKTYNNEKYFPSGTVWVCPLKISKPAYARHSLITLIREMLCNQELKIILEWIPGHVGIAGNEKADTPAKESVTLLITSNIPVALPDCLRKISRYFKNTWQTMWYQGKSKHLQIKPLLIPTVPENLTSTSESHNTTKA